jgi:hypothetical protein
MSEEEKKAIEMLDKFITEHKLYNIKQSDGLEDNIKKVLNLIEKQEKVIDEMAKWIEKNGYYTYGYANPTCDIVQDSCLNNHCLDRKSRDCQNCMKQYFYRKVENNE